MASQPIPKYHIAPNFAIPPVEAGGVLELGSIITSIATADRPLNEDCHVRIPQIKLFCSHQTGFTSTASRMKDGDYGIRAKTVATGGVGSELSWSHSRSNEYAYHFRGIDTIYFNPTQDYMEESMNKDDVNESMIGLGINHVYMVTGLKTARGPSVQMSRGKKESITIESELQAGGLSINLGPKLNSSKENKEEMGFQDSTDFIIGIRITKLMFKKQWLVWGRRSLVAKEHYSGAYMVDDSFVKSRSEVVDLGDESKDQIELGMGESSGETLDTEWVVE
ncbi:hypothetical protein G7Z17_g4206 [Cylindrodendrum hubeiense]|uniref:Uncharacterized protein n=1 Tax=Cylindrodendrum hubeiense TaxID=595255 RepID=A0A9P5H9A5_9HYPO|nr:hypothetical protein G7Z17_g4206 [Cylindrodendrum hubeiense]